MHVKPIYTFVLSLFTICISSSIIAQVRSDSLIIGSWKLEGYGFQKITSPLNFEQTITFFPNHTYQIVSYTLASDSSTTITSGKWRLHTSTNKNKLELSARSDFFQGKEKKKLKRDENNITITDSTLVIIAYEGRYRFLKHFKKVPDIPKMEDTNFPSRAYSYDYQISNKFFLINSADTSKKIELKNSFSLDLNSNIEIDDTSNVESSSISIRGFPDNIMDSIITMNINQETISIEYKNYKSINIEKQYGFSNDNVTRDILLKDISSLNYHSHNRDNWFSTGTTIIALSTITALFIAPLASINYISGGFNSQRYFKIAGAGLAAITICIPVTLLSRPKSFNIAHNRNTKDKNYWRITCE